MRTNSKPSVASKYAKGCAVAGFAFIILLAPAIGLKKLRDARIEEAVGRSMRTHPEARVQLFPRNRTIKMYTHNRLLGPYLASFNGEGFRDRDYPKRKPPGAVRIIVLGDSFLFGWGVRQDETFDARLEKVYEDADRAPRVEAINMAIPGLNHRSELKILKAIGLGYGPGVVLLLLNRDDIFPDNNNYRFGDAPALDGRFARLVSGDAAEKEKELWMRRLESARTEKDLRKLGLDALWNGFAATPIREMNALAEQHGFRLTLLNLTDPPLKPLYDRLARELGIPMIDLRDARGLKNKYGYGDAPMSIPGDGHPTAAALDLYARLVASKLDLPDVR